MFDTHTDRVWEKFGQDDPYYSIITNEKFRKPHLTPESKEAFFESGLDYLREVLGKIRQDIDKTFTIRRALDFGCGVGRLVIPLACIAQEVTGVDVSDSMLEEARKNCEARSIKNVVFIKSDDNLSRLEDKYDFVHSAFVFQHIPVTRGERIFKNLIAHLDSEGVCVVHFTYAKDPPASKFASWIKRSVPIANHFINLLKGRKVSTPRMQWNAYNLNQLFLTIQRAGAIESHCAFTNHGGDLGIMVYFQMPKVAQSKVSQRF